MSEMKANLPETISSESELEELLSKPSSNVVDMMKQKEALC